MSERVCPDELELVRLVDRDLSAETAQRVAVHVAGCARCAEQHATLLGLRERLGEPMVRELDVCAHVADVMQRIDAPRTRLERRWLPWTAAGLVFGAVALWQLRARDRLPDGVAARGGSTPASIARDVGVQAYASDGALRALAPGDVIANDTPLTAGFRNLGAHPVFLLLFAIDARHALHWIAPAYKSAASDPEAQRLPPSPREQLLPETVVLDDPAPGPLRIVSVISPTSARVSTIEALEGQEFDARAIVRRLPQAEVRESVLQVRAREGAP